MRRTPASISSQNREEILKLAQMEDGYMEQAVALLHERLHFSQEVTKIGRYFFQDPDQYEAGAVKKRWEADSTKIIVEFSTEIAKLDTFNAVEIETALRKVAQEAGVPATKLIHPVRLAVTGVSGGPGLFEILALLGKETVIRRITKAASVIPGLL